LTTDEALALARAADDLNYARVVHPGVEISDAINSAWSGYDLAEYVLEMPLAKDVLEILSDDLVREVPALAPLREALRAIQLRPPLFVKPDEPLFIFDSEETALQIEWQDLTDDDGYQGYDRDGRPFRLEARTWKEKFLGLVPYEQGETTLRVLESPERPDELRELLIDALTAVGAEARSNLESLSLGDLQATALDRFGLM
jgi:hypothetical protein